MFLLMLIIGLFMTCGGAVRAYFVKSTKPKHAILHMNAALASGAIGLALCVGSFQTPGGQIAATQFTASGIGGNWLVVDNSGGETMRHWVLENKLVESTSQSDGWQFNDENGLCYVSGDCFVLKINNLETFKQNYRTKYNIPKDQVALK